MKNVTMRDLMDIRFLSEPALSPDGAHTAFVSSVQSYDDNDYKSCIHLIDNATGKSRQLTHAGKERAFTWLDNRTLLFAAERGEADKPAEFAEKTCFYRLQIDGGEACKLFEIDKNVNTIIPLGAGKYAFTATVDLNAPAPDMDKTLRADEKDYHVLEEVPFWANGRGYVSRLRNTLYTFDASTGNVERISDEFFNVSGFDCDGTRILYAGTEYRDRITPYGQARIYDVNTRATQDLLPQDTFGVGDVILTAGGALLALSTFKPWGLCQLHDLYRFDSATGELHLAHALDMCIGPDVLFDCSYGGGRIMKAIGDDVYFIAQRAYRAEIYRLSAADELTKCVAFDGCVLAFDTDGSYTTFVGHPANGLGELYAVKAGAAEPLTTFNSAFLAEHYVAKARYIPFTNSDGVQIDGWALEPQDFDPDKRYPAILEIHGGPRCAYGEMFFHEMQAFVGSGYLVFYCNPRGSEGYGEAFADLRGRYGTVDYQDLMEFTDHVLELYPQIDRSAIGAAGGSYGGFMCNWIEGHTDRFAAIASQRSISNWVADFGSSEIGFTFDANEMGADPWTGMEKMWQQSPLKYACNARTPILFIHSLGDYNCTVDQGIEMFAAMKYFGVPARMCLFEGENHSLSRSGKPRHRLRRLSEMMNWFDRYLKKS